MCCVLEGNVDLGHSLIHLQQIHLGRLRLSEERGLEWSAYSCQLKENHNFFRAVAVQSQGAGVPYHL